jgi:hypothetical protein
VSTSWNDQIVDFQVPESPRSVDLFRKLTQSCCKMNFWKDVEIDLLVLPRGFYWYIQSFFIADPQNPHGERASLLPPSPLPTCPQRLLDATVLPALSRRVVDGRRHTWRTAEMPSPSDFWLPTPCTDQDLPGRPPRPAPACECCASGAPRCSVSMLRCCCVGSFGAVRWCLGEVWARDPGVGRSRGGAGRSRGVLVRFPHRCAALRAFLRAAHTALRAPKRGALRSPQGSAPLRVSKRCRSCVLLCALRAAERFSAMRARCSACCARTSDCDR